MARLIAQAVGPAVSLTVLLAACASAPPVPKTPAELLVGAWNCTLSDAEADAFYVATFRKSGSMNLDFEGQFDVEGFDVDVDMEVDGSYVLQDMRLGGTFEDATINKLLIDGEPIDEDTTAMFESMFVEMAADAVDSEIGTLDEKQLVLLGEEGSSYMSCTRRTA